MSNHAGAITLLQRANAIDSIGFYVIGRPNNSFEKTIHCRVWSDMLEMSSLVADELTEELNRAIEPVKKKWAEDLTSEAKKLL